MSNKAKVKDNVRREEPKLSTWATLSGQWTYSRGIRRTLVWPGGIRFRGLVSARNRTGHSVWEVDHLLLDELDKDCCLSLLVKISSVLEELGVEKVFLRNYAESPLVKTAKEAGFVPYVTESFYGRKRKEGEIAGDDVNFSFRHRRKGINDDYRLFELYEACLPASIRQVEGITFQEWQSARDRWSGEDWLFEEDGCLIGWMRVKIDGNAAQIEIPATREDKLEQIVEYGLKTLDGCRELFCIIPGFQIKQARLFNDQGFSELNKYSVSFKELTSRTRKPLLVPIGI